MLFSAVFDTCSLVPITQTDTLLRMAELRFFRPLWSDKILSELQRALEDIYPDMADTNSAIRRINIMRDVFFDALVEDWEPLESCITLPDPKDRHVVAAAIRGQAHVIVTNNISDFPASELAKFDIDVQTPDEFLLNQLDLRPGETLRVLQEQSESMRNPSVELWELLDALSACGAKDFAEAARKQTWRV